MQLQLGEPRWAPRHGRAGRVTQATVRLSPSSVIVAYGLQDEPRSADPTLRL